MRENRAERDSALHHPAGRPHTPTSVIGGIKAKDEGKSRRATKDRSATSAMEVRGSSSTPSSQQHDWRTSFKFVQLARQEPRTPKTRVRATYSGRAHRTSDLILPWLRVYWTCALLSRT